MQDIPRDSSRLPGQRSGSCVRAGQSRQFQALCWEYTDPTGRMYELACSSRLLPCRRIDGVYHQRTVTPAERTEDFRPTSYRRAQSQHVLIIAEKTCWLTNALSVVGWCYTHAPHRGESAEVRNAARTSPNWGFKGAFKKVYSEPPGKKWHRKTPQVVIVSPPPSHVKGL